MTKPSPYTLLALLGALSCATEDSATPARLIIWEPAHAINEQLPPAVRVFYGTNTELPLRAWYVLIDQNEPPVRTQVVVSNDTTDNRETVSSFAEDMGACVAVNGGYFRMDQTPSGHVGLVVTRGEVLWPATRSVLRDSLSYETARAAIGFNGRGEVEISWATTREGSVYSWPDPPAHKPGTPAEQLDYDDGEVWDVLYAVAGGPALVVDGIVRVTTNEEVFFGTAIPNVHPRTAAGRTRDGALVIMVVDGRQAASRGVSLEELATLMLEAGAVDALNLDGGGSSTLVVNGELLNLPTGDMFQREVMSALVTFCE